jgi:putative NADPH-quinone reductase
MKYFFVFAHPENEHSFQKSLLDHAIAELRAEGHDVRISDLYAMEFEPVASRKDFKTRRFPDRLQYDREQKFAVQNKDLPSDVAAELDNLFWCDVLVMQFPLYWFSMPAIMKGWVDRVFLNSLAVSKASVQWFARRQVGLTRCSLLMGCWGTCMPLFGTYSTACSITQASKFYRHLLRGRPCALVMSNALNITAATARDYWTQPQPNYWISITLPTLEATSK